MQYSQVFRNYTHRNLTIKFLYITLLHCKCKCKTKWELNAKCFHSHRKIVHIDFNTHKDGVFVTFSFLILYIVMQCIIKHFPMHRCPIVHKFLSHNILIFRRIVHKTIGECTPTPPIPVLCAIKLREPEPISLYTCKRNAGFSSTFVA